jgi:hypothetical protein
MLEPDPIDYATVSGGGAPEDEVSAATLYRLAQAAKLIRMVKAYDAANPRAHRRLRC